MPSTHDHAMPTDAKTHAVPCENIRHPPKDTQSFSIQAVTIHVMRYDYMLPYVRGIEAVQIMLTFSLGDSSWTCQNTLPRSPAPLRPNPQKIISLRIRFLNPCKNRVQTKIRRKLSHNLASLEVG